MFKRPPIADRTGIRLQTLHGRFTDGGADLTVTEANAIIEVFNEDGIYPRRKISQRTLKQSTIINITELWRRSGYDSAILEAFNKERWERFSDEHQKRFGKVISEMFNEG
jgi:hypothetical protein